VTKPVIEESEYNLVTSLKIYKCRHL